MKTHQLILTTESGMRVKLYKERHISETAINLKFDPNRNSKNIITNKNGTFYTNQFGDAAAQEFSDYIANSTTLKTINISGHNFSDAGLLILAEGLRKNNSVESIVIIDNADYNGKNKATSVGVLALM